MFKTVIHIEGMACPMCEAHINDAIRNLVPKAQKVKSSFKMGECSFLSENPPALEVIEAKISDMGYKVLSITAKPEEKKKFGFF